MKKYCLIGHPLGHSLSPQIHTRLFALSGREAAYELRDIPPEELAGRFAELAGLDGFNITIPHKMAIIDYCDELSEGAARYHSVNCVQNGERKTGHNTDCIGFVKSIEMMGVPLQRGTSVLLIGCGGVGRMIAIECARLGAEVTICALESDRELAGKVVEDVENACGERCRLFIMKGSKLSPEDYEGGSFDLLINATPVGMFPKVDNCPCEDAVIDAAGGVFDVIYNPKETLLVKKAREKGKNAMCGMAMLVLQAVAAHEIWYGASFAQKDIDTLISDMEQLV